MNPSGAVYKASTYLLISKLYTLSLTFKEIQRCDRFSIGAFIFHFHLMVV